MTLLPTTPNVSHHHHSLIDDYALERIGFRVDRLARLFSLAEDTRDDYRQEMLVELVKAARRFDPHRSQPRTFVNRVLDRYFKGAMRSEATRRRHQLHTPLCLDELSEDAMPATNASRPPSLDEQDRLELQIDVQTVLKSMPDRLRRISLALMTFTASEAAQRLGIGKNTVYRAIEQLRPYFLAAGFGEKS